jgi:hypothetical protein
MSPEELENEVDQTPEPEPQPEPEKPRRIEVDPEELKELREANRQMRDELHQHKMWQMQQAQQQRQAPEPDPQVDPDVERVIAPVIRKQLRPLEEENRQLKSQLAQTSENLRVQSNIDYIERNIPNFEEIRQDLAKEIESMPKADQDMILSSPTLMVRLAKSLNADRGKASTQAARGRNYTESSTGTSPTKNTSALGNVDWGSLSDAEFAAQEAKIEQARRRR